MKLNKKTYLDKLHGCWLGKNIGGTIGAPYEGTHEFLDIKGFKSQKGEPLPNDDLDLQLVWLVALEQKGVKNFDTNMLAEYWLDWISPHWNEYGIAKANLRMGLLPPMSGEYDNEKWKTSNGAWIRSEIWASLAPGAPDVAIKYATMDAMVDHGISEGCTAEIFTAALQSAAYVESDIPKLIDLALSRIPEDSMVAKTVRLVIDLYRAGTPYRQTRERVLEFNRELGWFQAPANLGFVTIGLLYGEGDFKKSVIYAVNCGDDTDCTAATVGATLGIIDGAEKIPADWREYVGDSIVTIAINNMYRYYIPKSCNQLADRVAALVTPLLRENLVNFSFTDGENEISESDFNSYRSIIAPCDSSRAPYSFDLNHYHAIGARVELDGTPHVCPFDTRRITVTFNSKVHIRQTHKLFLRAILPDGWQTEGLSQVVNLDYMQPEHGVFGRSRIDFNIKVGEQVSPINRLYLEVVAPMLARPFIIPINLIG